MSDNLQKLVGLVAMAVLVVLGVVLTNDDDTDYSRNRSFRETAGTFAGADRVKEADCCDQTLALLGSMQTQLTQINSQLQTLQADAQWSTSPASPEVQQIADLMAETCPDADPANWTVDNVAREGAICVRSYLVGFPVELARQVVLTHGKLGFFHRFNFDLGNKSSYSWGSLDDVITEEACGPIFYGYNPPPRMAIAVDTHQGVVLPRVNELQGATNNTAYMQEKEHWYLFDEDPFMPKVNSMYWPEKLEDHEEWCE